MSRSPAPFWDRFWAKVDKTDSCWLWSGGKSKNGYGLISLGAPSRLLVYVHRAIWASAYGPILEGMNVCHHCDTPACVNHGHLFLGTHQQNMDDRGSKGRCQHGETHYNAKLTEADIHVIRAARGVELQRVTASRFDIHSAHVCAIQRRQRWSWVPEEGVI